MKTMSALKATATIGAAIVLALLTVQGTLALWNATATSKSQSVQSADFKVTVKVGDREPQRLPASGNIAVAAPSGLMPGISKATRIVVTNDTDAGGAFTVKATASGLAVSGELKQYLSTSIGLDHDGSCTVVQQGTSIVLAKDASAAFCLTTRLAATAPATLGGGGAAIAFTLTTEQQSR